MESASVELAEDALPQQVLPPETTVFATGEHTGPPEISRSEVSVFDEPSPLPEELNYLNEVVRNVQMVGDEVVIEAGRKLTRGGTFLMDRLSKPEFGDVERIIAIPPSGREEFIRVNGRRAEPFYVVQRGGMACTGVTAMVMSAPSRLWPPAS